MISIAKMVVGSEQYYVQYAASNYYSECGDQPGTWWGLGASKLGLSGEVKPQVLTNLFLGLSPDGTQPLVQLSSIRNDYQRAAGWDVCFSPPKDVSVAWGFYDDWKPVIEKCQQTAVTAGLNFYQEYAGFTRRGRGGTRLEACDLVVALFNHGTSRNSEPQLHTHALVLNSGIRPSDGLGSTVHSQLIYNHQIGARRVYLATLARELQHELGFQIEATEPKAFEPGDSFRIAGIPERLRMQLSSRRVEILAAIAQRRQSSARSAAIAALATRKPKIHLPETFLRQQWRSIAASLDVDVDKLRQTMLSPVVLERPTTEATVIRQPTRELTDDAKPSGQPKIVPLKRSDNPSPLLNNGSPQKMDTPQPVDSDFGIMPGYSARVQASVLTNLTKSVLEAELPDSIFNRLVDSVLDQYNRENPTGKFQDSADRLKEAQEALAPMLATAERLHANQRHALDKDKVIAGLTGRMISNPEGEALVHSLSSTGAIACVDATPGVNTSEFIKSLDRAYSKHGFSVKPFTARATAASELETSTELTTHTIGQLLYRLDPSATTLLRHHARQFIRTALGRPAYTFERWKLDDRTILVVTQAQQIPTHKLNQLLEHAESSGAKVILLGDVKHLPLREPHNAYAQLADRVGKQVLSGPTRQTEEWMSDAIRQVARGDIRGALSQYVLANRVHISKDQRDATADMIRHWKSLSKSEQNGKTIMVASNMREAQLLNRMAHEVRRKSGGLGLLMWQKVDGVWVRRGDRILFRITSKHHGFRAGDFGTIERINLSSMTIRLDRTHKFLGIRHHVRVAVPKYLYRGLTLGYAVSATDAVGMTCDRALVLPKPGGADARSMLAQLSVGRNETRIFTPAHTLGEDVEATAKYLRMQVQTQTQRELKNKAASLHAAKGVRV